MSPLTESVDMINVRRSSKIGLWIAIIAVIAALIAIFITIRTKGATSVGVIQKSKITSIFQSGTLRVGYGGFPPYTIIDPKETDQNKRVSGFSVDLVNEIAARCTPPLKVEWVLFSWETIKADMMSGKFDLIADPVFQTIPRAMDMELCDPYSYFGIAVALVKKDDNRFREFRDLDRSDITIALAAGWTSSEYAKKHLSKPNFKEIPVTGDAVNQLDEVILGRADVALNDVPSIAQYVRAHKDKVKALWLDRPPSNVAGGFVIKKGEQEFKNFLNTSVRTLIADGTIKRIDEKWKSFGFLPVLNVTPGAGILESSDMLSNTTR